MTAGSGLGGQWLPHGAPAGTAPRLLCLPHAGSGASVYREWGASLHPQIAVCPLQPPGRETRMREAAAHSVTPLVREAAEELSGLLDQPYAVFGHSVGALVAFELVREIRRRGLPPPTRLFVSGRAAPQLPDPGPPMRDMDAQRLSQVLRELGGTPREVLEDTRLLEFITPLFRADFAVNETYRYFPEAPLDVPITAFGATADPRADRWQTLAWEHQTARGFREHLLTGGHFAVLEQADRVHALIRAELEQDTAEGRLPDYATRPGTITSETEVEP